MDEDALYATRFANRFRKLDSIRKAMVRNGIEKLLKAILRITHGHQNDTIVTYVDVCNLVLYFTNTLRGNEF